jgi:ribosome biogenesis GTPase / thiamine phosphate phosphatase
MVTGSASLRSLGADAALLADIESRLERAGSGPLAARVSRVDRGRFSALSAEGPLSVATAGVSPVCVGDWCIVRPGEESGGETPNYDLVEVLPRRTALIRQSSGGRTESQALAANIDIVTVVVPLDRPVSRRQVERFLVLAWDSGAVPELILTKRDLVSDVVAAEAVAEVMAVSGDIAIHTVSVVTGEGMDGVTALVGDGRTVALLGTSGSGKSSLVNALVGTDAVAVGEVRQSDAKGRHTTTWRELVVVPTGGVLIDTPGLRELGMWIDEEGIEAAFADITALGDECRFTDCAHDSEPDCAVRAAVVAGTLDPERLASYRKLLGEAAYAAEKNDLRLAREDQRATRQRPAGGRRRPRPQ